MSDGHETDPTTDPTTTAVARRLRDALHREADMTTPSDDGLGRILDRVEQLDAPDGGPERPSRRQAWVPWVAGIAAATVIGVVAAMALTGGDDDRTAPAATSSETTSPSPTTEPEPSGTPSDPAPEPTTPPPAGQLDQVPVYWTGQRPSGVYLYREFRTVPDAGGVVASAVRAMMTQTPLDPDFTSPWRQPSALAVSAADGAITVDVSADAFARTGVDAALAAAAVQQLVWTATAAAQSADPVVVLVDGAAGFRAWDAVELGGPMSRDAAARAYLWLDTPAEGDVVPAGTVEVTGQADVVEGNVSWEVVDASGTQVAEGFATAAMGEFVPFSFTVELAPGTYTVSAWSADESGGESAEGPRMWEQTRTFDVQ